MVECQSRWPALFSSEEVRILSDKWVKKDVNSTVSTEMSAFLRSVIRCAANASFISWLLKSPPPWVVSGHFY